MLSGSMCFRVRQNDRLAFLSTTEQAPIGHEFVSSGTDGLFYTHNGTSLPSVNNDVQFDTLPMPYEFAVSVALDLGTWKCYLLFVRGSAGGGGCGGRCTVVA